MPDRIVTAVQLAWRAAGRGVVEFYNSDNLTFASSIAYYSLLSLFPFLLLVLSLLGWFTAAQDSGAILQVLARALPRQFDFVSTQIAMLSNASFKLSLLGTVIASWASMGVFGALTSAVNHAWGVERTYSYWKHKLISFVMMITAGLLLISVLLLFSATQIVEARWFSGVLASFPHLSQLTGFFYQNAVTPTFIVVVGLIYRFAPNTNVRLRDVWFGAILAGVLWRFAFAGFSWYVRDLSRFSVHGSVAAVVAFLLWVYLSAVILLYGVEVTAAYARLRRENAAARRAAISVS